MRQSLADPSNGLTIIAAVGCPGSTVEIQTCPSGMFVTIDLDLYVADTNNHLVQLFRTEGRSGETVAGDDATHGSGC